MRKLLRVLALLALFLLGVWGWNYYRANVGFTPWMSRPDLDQFMTRFASKAPGGHPDYWDKGHWIDAVEGRWHDGIPQYRIKYSAVPADCNGEWFWYINQGQDSFTDLVHKLADQGMVLLDPNSFLRPDNSRRYQGVWHLLTPRNKGIMAGPSLTSTNQMAKAPPVSSAAVPAAPTALMRPDLSSHPGRPPAHPADVATLPAIVHAFYSTISVPAGGKIDLPRLLSLFVPTGRIVVSLPPRGPQPADVIFLSPEQYARNSDAQTATLGFFDRNPANQIERFGVMAHVYSTYESRSGIDDKKPTARGIKSFELIHSAGRWYIIQVYWEAERPDNRLSSRYYHDSSR